MAMASGRMRVIFMFWCLVSCYYENGRDRGIALGAVGRRKKMDTQ
jgi:hypothetical protein